MADKRSPKKTFNPLLNVSVTGATLEEFTQNAILCPAADPAPAPVLQAVPLTSQPEPEQSANNFTDISQQLTNNYTFQQPEFQQIRTYQSEYNTQPSYNPAVFPPPVSGPPAPEQSVSDSNVSTLSSSVLSSFSNILSFANQTKKEEVIEEPVGPNPNSVEHLLNSSVGEPNASFIPLYSASTHGDNFALSGPSLSGPPLTGPALSGHSKSTSRLFRPKSSSGLTNLPLSEPPTSVSSEYSTPGSVLPPPPTGLSRPPSSRSSPGLFQPRSYSPGLTSSGLSGPVSGKSTPDLSASGRPPSGSSSEIPTVPLIGRPISPSVSRSRTSSNSSGRQQTGLPKLGVSALPPTSGFSLPPSNIPDFGKPTPSLAGSTVPSTGLNRPPSSTSSGLTGPPPPTSFELTGQPPSDPFGLKDPQIPSSVSSSRPPLTIPSGSFEPPSSTSSGLVGPPPSVSFGLPGSQIISSNPFGLSGPPLSTVSGLSGPLPSASLGLTGSKVPLSGLSGPLPFAPSALSAPPSSNPFVLTGTTESSSGLSGSNLPAPAKSEASNSELPISGSSGTVLPPTEIPLSRLSESGISVSGLSGPGISSGVSGQSVPPPETVGFFQSEKSAFPLSGPPLAPSGVSSNTVPPSIPQGPNNTYRRQGQKRIAYAPIPGFSSTPLQSVPQPQIEPSPYFPAQTSNQPVPKSSVQTQIRPQSQASIFAPPPVENKPSNLLIPSTDFNEVQSLDGTPSTFLTPVMSDVQSSSKSNPATLNSSATLVTTPMASADAGQVKPTSVMNSAPYRPVYHHWFHRKKIEDRVIWQPFSMMDSLALEAHYVSADLSPENMVATDGGRYDVNILRRQRIPVYWEGTPSVVRRCSWFYKTSNDGRFTPYKENIATKLEEEYKAAYELNQWHRKVDLPNGETVVFHSPDVLVLFPQTPGPDVYNQTPQTAQRPRVVKRGMDEFDIDEGEPSKIDHLLFLCHGIGSVCDLKFRSVEEVVDDFRSISLQLVQSHYKSSCDHGVANRIEVLPVSWHNQLHSEDTGIDRKLKSITLESIPRLRDFTNDTLLDILFYTSPIYSQTIISTVGNELNRIYALFKQRNPGFKGQVSLGGHSLGSLILFDILCHQHPAEKEDTTPDEEDDVVGVMKTVPKPSPANRRLSRRISYMMGAVGTGQPQLIYPHLNFCPVAFFALGSPIGMFVTVRGLESLGEQFALPTCPGFFNIFHPYDPVAYRVESLINPELANVRPVLIPHHKGRKRMHLELKETMARVGADLKQRIVDSVKSTWNSVYQLAVFHRTDNRSLEAEVDKVLKEQLANEENERLRLNSFSEDEKVSDVRAGILNNGRRIDYVLQEAPFEFFNEYIFALTSHVCYWESEDTMLLILKEIYSSMGISADNQIPQQTMTIERSSPSEADGPHSLQMSNPLRPTIFNPLLGDSQSTSFVRKT